jgi:hypothetical protein
VPHAAPGLHPHIYAAAPGHPHPHLPPHHAAAHHAAGPLPGHPPPPGPASWASLDQHARHSSRYTFAHSPQSATSAPGHPGMLPGALQGAVLGPAAAEAAGACQCPVCVFHTTLCPLCGRPCQEPVLLGSVAYCRLCMAGWLRTGSAVCSSSGRQLLWPPGQ